MGRLPTARLRRNWRLGPLQLAPCWRTTIAGRFAPQAARNADMMVLVSYSGHCEEHRRFVCGTSREI
eukprot:7541428-Alexandrium_andersonii.AAC.1